MKEEAEKVFVKHGGTWINVETVGLSTTQVQTYHRLLYGIDRVPSTWVFNDFGHMTCYVYRDRNNNRRRDTNEPIHGEFIHPTPRDEASVRRGLTVQLSQSHGCIHVKPFDMDDMIRRRFLAKNNLVVVHPYTEVAIPFVSSTQGSRRQIELHFFPSVSKLCALAVSNA